VGDHVSNPASPVGVFFYGTSGIPETVTVSGLYVYLAAYDAGVHVFFILNPASPVKILSYDTLGWAYHVAVSGNYAYVADAVGLRVLDVSNLPAFPAEVGFYNMPGGNAMRVTVSDEYAYVADGPAGLRMINVATPASPVEVGFYDTPVSTMDVAVDENYIYVVDSFEGLFILRFVPRQYLYLPLVLRSTP